MGAPIKGTDQSANPSLSRQCHERLCRIKAEAEDTKPTFGPWRLAEAIGVAGGDPETLATCSVSAASAVFCSRRPFKKMSRVRIQMLDFNRV